LETESALPFWVPWLVEFLKVAIPSTLVVIGWNVVSRGNDRRESRKEKRQLVDKTIDHIDSIVEDAVVFFTSEDDEEAEHRAGKVLADLKRIETFLQALDLKDPASNGKTLITATTLRQSITGDGPFWTRPRVRLNLGSSLLSVIRSEAMQLVSKLETSYLALYSK